MLQAAQHREAAVVVEFVVVVAVFASASSSILRTLTAFLCPSFVAFVNHSRANSFD